MTDLGSDTIEQFVNDIKTVFIHTNLKDLCRFQISIKTLDINLLASFVSHGWHASFVEINLMSLSSKRKSDRRNSSGLRWRSVRIARGWRSWNSRLILVSLSRLCESTLSRIFFNLWRVTDYWFRDLTYWGWRYPLERPSTSTNYWNLIKTSLHSFNSEDPVSNLHSFRNHYPLFLDFIRNIAKIEFLMEKKRNNLQLV